MGIITVSGSDQALWDGRKGSPGVMEGKHRTVAMGKHRMIDRLRK